MSDSEISFDEEKNKIFKEKRVARKETEEKVKLLEEIIQKNGVVSYDSECVRKKSNWSKLEDEYKLDNDEFSPNYLLKSLPNSSPKLHTLLQKIKDLDKKDKKEHGKLFKHFIFSDLKFGAYGAKLLASALIADGYNLAYKANRIEGVDNDSKSKKRYEKIELLSDEVLQKSKGDNFYLLSSVGVYDQNITVKMKKDMLQKYNQRPDNVYGDLVRFIILDSGFKEGIDLFDVKYVHIFEPSTVLSDQKQVIGRATRTCGQKGIEFHPVYGWPLHVFIYDLSIPDKIQGSLMNSKTTMELFLKSMNLDMRLLNFSHDLEKATILGSVDYDLNKNVHSFSIPFISGKEDKEHHAIKENEHVDKDIELMYGGADAAPKLVIRPGIKKIIDGQLKEVPSQNNKLGYDEMREYIRDNFSEFAWDAVKMENLCEDKTKGGNSTIIKYTPTQDFIKHYFSPMNYIKGMLLYHSVGTGKTCSAIAAATANFEKNGYTILWVTRTTLKNDIWKNMFDQVCNETIRNQMENHNLQIPKESDKRMRLLAKAWRIRPMSYKQFSNLILKQNVFYENLVKINGKEDPLRKTLLIIDEAHKLYGGDDLSSIEKPDMNALKQALMYSYQYSGQDSVRLLLMTATPITNDPMELVKLVNLCKPPQEQMPSDFLNFAEQYLDDNGDFTPEGRMKYLDDIAGHVSYLNREKDARQFSQPQIQHIYTPIISDVKNVEKFDKKIVKELLEENSDDLKGQLEAESKMLEGQLGNLSKSKFLFLKNEVCEDLSGKHKSGCKKIVNDNIKQLMKEAKEYAAEIKNKIKDINKMMKERKKVKGDVLKNVRQNIKKYGTEYEKYKTSLLYELKNKCSKRIVSEDKLKEELSKHADIQSYDEEIEKYDKEIENLNNDLKMMTENYKIRMKHLRQLLKTNLNDLERNVVNAVVRDERKEYNKMLRIKKKENAHSEKIIKKNINVINKNKTKRKREITKNIKVQIKDERKKVKTLKREEKKIRKTAKDYKGIMKHEVLKELIGKYRGKILEDMVELDEEMRLKEEEKQKEKDEKKKAKEAEKAKVRETKRLLQEEKKKEKQAEKNKARETKKLESEEKKKAKQAEKMKARETKKLESEEKKKAEKAKKDAQKKAEKEAKKLANKTRKNNK